MTTKDKNAGRVTQLPDDRPVGPQSRVFKLGNGLALRVDVLKANVFRLRYSVNGRWTESALNRYGILKDDFAPAPFTCADGAGGGTAVLRTEAGELAVVLADGRVSFRDAGGATLTTQSDAPQVGRGYTLSFDLCADERLYGLGDASRENIMRRGGAYALWVENVKCYIPIPVVLSSCGWGLMINSTWRQAVDVGKTHSERLLFTAPQSNTDYYLFAGADYAALLDTYTELSGRPALLPIWAYALTYVCNEHVDNFRMMDDAMAFRREGIPCDVLGLEPGWMSKYYDYSTEKAWDPGRFPIPKWAAKGPSTVMGALDRQDFKLSLWLCTDYDFSVHEEQCIAGVQPPLRPDELAPLPGDDDDFEKDEHFQQPKAGDAGAGTDGAAAPAASAAELEPWIEHLKKFMDQGARAFKLDGWRQVLEHPDRDWGNGMSDEQMHNLYPLIYDKQMARGVEAHTGRRAMVYSASGFAGVQQFVASWAGDTGGGPKPLLSMLNLGFSGHSNHSCDMDVFTRDGIHFGFLQTWAQLNNWAYWRQPWFLTAADKAMFKDYACLRYALLPYLYSSAYQAALTGWPVMRAMAMVCPDDPGVDEARTQYMLGDFFLVTAFAEEVVLPAGLWVDFWTGDTLRGPQRLPARHPDNRGGCLYVKAGAIIPTWPVQQSVNQGWHEDLGLMVFPGEGESAFTLYEDDGQSTDYRQGHFAQTRFSCNGRADGAEIAIASRQGKFAGMAAERTLTLRVRCPRRPGRICVDSAVVTRWQWDVDKRDAVVVIAGQASDAHRVVVDWG